CANRRAGWPHRRDGPLPESRARALRRSHALARLQHGTRHVPARWPAMSRWSRVSLLGVLCVLSGCGLHLQGAGSLPPAVGKTYVATRSARSDFLLALTDTLRQRGAEVLRAPDESAAVLDIAADETGQRVLSVSARNIPREYEVFYSVTFSLKVAGKNVID